MALYTLGDRRADLPEEGTYWIAPSASVIGSVRLERQVGIWFGAVLRGDNELIHISEGSNIQDGCVLHTDPGFPLMVGAGCTVGHQATLHGCTVGCNSLIGMGATVLNGARIGENCIIGAHALVTEGKEIPDNSLVVGSPGKVVRELDSKTVESLGEMAGIYIRRIDIYLKGFQLDPRSID